MSYDGFIVSLENEGYSQQTVESYEAVLNQFYAYLGQKYKKRVDPVDIQASDIKGYLKEQVEKRQKQISTVNKELAVLKSYFNFLWEHNIVAVDPAVKIKRFMVDSRPVVDVTYGELKKVLQKVLDNPTYPPIRKAIFVLAMKGLKSSEFKIKKRQIEISDHDNKVYVHLHNRSITLEGEEAETFLEYYYSACLNSGEYLSTSTTQKKKEVVPIKLKTLLNHIKIIVKDYLPEHSRSLTLISIRRAIMYHHFVNGMSVQQIADIMGLQEDSVAYYINRVDGKPEKTKNP